MNILSLITVTYNAERHINGLINSLELQTNKNFQWIVVDGESTDETLNLVRAARIRNKLILSEPDDGIYDAMNKGVKISNGKWLLFINADDLLEEDGVDNILRIARSLLDDTIKVICFSSHELDVDGKNMGLLSSSIRMIFFYNSIVHPASIIRRSVFDEFKYNIEYQIAADYDLFLKIIIKYKKSFLFYNNIIVSKHRRGGISSNMTLSRSEIDKIKKNNLGIFIGSIINFLLLLRREFLKIYKYKNLKKK